MKRKYLLLHDDYDNLFLCKADGIKIDGIVVTSHFDNFFANLDTDKESKCGKIYIKRYAKKLLAD